MSKLILSGIVSLSVSVIVVVVSRLWDKHKNEKEKVNRLKGEIYALCDKIIQYAYHANSRVLAGRQRYALYIEKLDPEMDRSTALKYFSEYENYSFQCQLLQTELAYKVNEIKAIWNIWEYKEIKRLLLLKEVSIFNTYEGLFEGVRMESDINALYEKEISKLDKYLHEETFAKNLIKIQLIIDPELCQNKIQSRGWKIN